LSPSRGKLCQSVSFFWAQTAVNSGQFDYTGCPSNNDFYYEGVISSPYYPKFYPPNTECYYYMTSEPGKVLSFNFTYFDLETCCDYVTIYDGNTMRSPKLVQIGGPNNTVTAPAGVYTATQRYALVTFQTDPVIQKTGFQFVYQSIFSWYPRLNSFGSEMFFAAHIPVIAAAPCNRDVVLMLSGLSTVGSQANFLKQLDFVANVLTPTWQVGEEKVRVVVYLMVDADYAVVWTAEDLADNKKLTEIVLSMTDLVPDVTQNNNTDLQCIFKYAQGAVSFEATEDKERKGVEKTVIAFVPQNPNDDQDFYEAMEFAHTIRTTDDTKTIVVAMGKSLDVPRLGLLGYGSGFTFQADYDDLAALVPSINSALCTSQSAACGA
uniref:CUB domain-containing protein n=1 Tax=Heligmosomoides polygyrus TaxID=6339 RepID=A0A183G7L3_HELPZ